MLIIRRQLSPDQSREINHLAGGWSFGEGQVDHRQDGEAILHYVSKQLGHSSITITVDYYGHLVPTRRRVIVNRLDDGPPRPAQSATNPQQPAEGDPILEDAT